MAKYLSKHEKLTFYVKGNKYRFSNGTYSTTDENQIKVLDKISSCARLSETESDKAETESDKAVKISKADKSTEDKKETSDFSTVNEDDATDEDDSSAEEDDSVVEEDEENATVESEDDAGASGDLA